MRRRWNVVASALVAVALLAACEEQSRVDPEADVVVEGVARRPDQSPLVDRPVKLGAGIGQRDAALAFLTLGLSCTSGNCTGHVEDTTTDAAGRYRFTLKGRDTQSSFGEAVTELVSVSAAPTGDQVSGAAISARFRIQVEQVRLPVLDLVDPGLTVEAPREVVARWQSVAPGPYELTFETDAPVALWRLVTAGTEASVDGRVLEDTAGRVVVSGGRRDRIEGSDLAIHWRSPGLAYASGAGAPPSRGRSCRWIAATVGPGRPDGSCGLTDGDLAASVPPGSVCPAGTGAESTVPCRLADAAIVDLGRPVPAELVVVRGCPGGCAVEVSGDGAAFRPVGTAPEGDGVIALDGSAVTAVKVATGSGPAGLGLREVSVWGPRPAAPPLQPPHDDLRGLFDGTADTEPSTLLLVLAALLIAAALAGTGFVIGRRRAN